MPKLPRTARVHPQPLRTGRASAPLGWYVAGAAVLALAATSGLVAFEAMRAPPAEKTAAAPAPKPPAPKAPEPKPPEPPRVATAPAPVAPAPPQPAAPEIPVPVPPIASPASPPLVASAPRPAPEPAPPSPAPAPPAVTAEAPPSPFPSEPAAAAQPAPARSLAEDPAAPTGCLPEGLKSVLADLAEKFGEVKVVSTTELRTDNHTPGSVRAKIHEACRAVDIRTAAPAAEVVAYLRTRREIAAAQSYRNGVIHFDASGGATPAAGAPPAAAAPPAAPRPALAKPRGAAPQEPAALPSRVREAAPRRARAIARQRRARDEPDTTGSPGGSRARDIRPPAQRRPAPDDAPTEPPAAPNPFAPAAPPRPER